MKKTRPAATVAAYLAALPAPKRAALRRLRRAIRSAAPRAQEVISYGIPSFRLDERQLVWFGASANHCAFYPGGIVRAFAKELAGWYTSKGTIRFAPDRPLPDALVRRIVKARIAENAVRAKRSRARKRPGVRPAARRRR